MSNVRRLHSVVNGGAKGDVFRPGGTLAVDDGNTQFISTQTGGAPAPRTQTRPKVHIPESVMEDAVLMASEGKISTKNAWDVKVIEGMEDTVANSLTDAAVDEYLTFTRMANVVESGAKVWTHRVDNTYQLSLQMVRRVLRTEAKADGKEEGEGGEGDGEGTNAKANNKRRRIERTIADSVDEINLDASSKIDHNKISDTISPLFRAITKRYDQGHAKGLLMNNAPVGLCGNMILDVDYSKSGKSRQQVAVESEGADARADMVRIEPLAEPTGKDASPKGGRKSGLAQQEAALMSALITSVVPKQEAITPSRAQSQRAPSQSQDGGVEADNDVFNGTGATNNSSFRAGSLAHNGPAEDDYDNDNGDWGAADDSYDDGNLLTGDGASNIQLGEGSSGSQIEMARRIADGTYELARMERALMGAVAEGGHGEDAWIDFSQDQADALAKQRNFIHSKSLGNIRKQSVAVDMSQDPQLLLTQQARKKARADKKVVTFITEEEMVDEAAIKESLKLNATNATALTPLGKELLGYAPSANNITLEMYGKDYQFCERRSKAHHLTLPSMRRDQLPWWLPVEAGNVRSFYQPFCTESAQWGSLRKTRATQNAIGATRDVLQYDEEGRVVDEYTTDMPADVFEAGGDDYDDGGIDNDNDMGYGTDLRASGLFNVAVPFGAEDGIEGGGTFGAGDDAMEGLDVTAENAIKLMDAPEMIEVLKVKTATVPTSVDVVRLREVMWRRVQDLANFDPQNGKSRSQAVTLGKKREREEDDDEDNEDALLAHLNDARFSDVITSMLPDIRSITRDGTLSPAFFFFAILFLANEHRIILENDPNDVADLFITRRMPSMLPAQAPVTTL